MVEQILLRLQELQWSGRVGRPKSIDSETMIQAVEEDLVGSTPRVLSELSISIWSCWTVPYITKILQKKKKNNNNKK